MNPDASILLWIQEYVRCDALTPAMTFITHLGDGGAVWIILAAVCLLFGRTRTAGALAAVSMACNFLVNNVFLKNFVARTRPYEAVEGLSRIIEAQRDFSFPSGHSGSSFAAATVIFLMCPRRYGISALVLASAIALSRLYVGVHYPTDVLAGGLIGAAAAILVCRGYEMLVYKRRAKAPGTGGDTV